MHCPTNVAQEGLGTVKGSSQFSLGFVQKLTHLTLRRREIVAKCTENVSQAWSSIGVDVRLRVDVRLGHVG